MKKIIYAGKNDHLLDQKLRVKYPLADIPLQVFNEMKMRVWAKAFDLEERVTLLNQEIEQFYDKEREKNEGVSVPETYPLHGED